MTNSIGKNNALVGVCLDREVKALLGKDACAEDRSLASYLLHHALENIRRVKPAIAGQVEAIRTEHLRLKQGLVCLATGLVLVAASFMNQLSVRQRSTSARVAMVKVKSKGKDQGADSDTFTADPHDQYGLVEWDSITEPA